MSNFIIEDLKNSWNKKDNGLIKIIIINIIIFLSIGIIKIFLQIGGLESLYIKFLRPAIRAPVKLKGKSKQISSSKFLGDLKNVTVLQSFPRDSCSFFHSVNVPTVFSGEIYKIFIRINYLG